MPNEILLYTVCVTLVVILLLFIWFWLRVQKMNIRAQQEQSIQLISDYSKMADETKSLAVECKQQLEKSNRTMLELIVMVDHFKQKQ